LYKIYIPSDKKSQATIKDPEQVKSVKAVERSNIHNEGCTWKQSNSSLLMKRYYSTYSRRCVLLHACSTFLAAI